MGKICFLQPSTAWNAAVPYSLPKDIGDKLIKWKKETLSGNFKHFIEAYQELPNILGYFALYPEDPNQAVIMANQGRSIPSSLITRPLPC